MYSCTWTSIVFKELIKIIACLMIIYFHIFTFVPGLIPLFGIDVWEHAYYLQYKNVRPDYVKAIWNVANWKDISERYQNARSQ